MKKIGFFEGVRGIAAFIVVISHFIQVFYPALFSSNVELVHNDFETTIPQTPLNFFYNGNFAVCIFFVLSGFVLSYKYIVKKDKDILVESAAKRYFRLAIPVTVSILFAYVLLKFNLYYYGYSMYITKSTMTDFYVMEPSIINALKEALVGSFFYNEFSHNAVLWTMYYELIGSFIVFSFLALFGNSRNRFVFYVVLLVLFWNTYFIAFVLGMILCDIYHHMNGKFVTFLRNKVVVFLFLISGIYLGSYPYVGTKGTIYEFIVFENLDINYFVMAHILGAFLLLIAVLNSNLLQKFFELKPFLYLGNISFSLYLIHFIMINSMSSYIFLKMYKLGVSYNQSFLISFSISLIFIFILSHFMNKYVDQKSVKISKTIYINFFKSKI